MATYVLIHGAYQGGWIWQPTATRLRAAGHVVYAPSLDGCADRRHSLRPGITVDTQAAEIAELLFYEDLNDVVLAGTSSGGMVACRAAELACERIGRLVFVDALALLHGERVAQIVNRPTPRVTTALAVGPWARWHLVQGWGACGPVFLLAWQEVLHPAVLGARPCGCASWQSAHVA